MKRLKAIGGAYYHLVNRCALQHFLFTDEDKDVFVAMLRRVAAFSGIDVLTHCVMSNHYHILVHVPPPRPLSETELLARVGILYGSDRAKDMRIRWADYRKHGLKDVLADEQNRLLGRMNDISPFMKSLNQRFSVWYRAHHAGHKGTLWESRFGSTLVEGNGSLAAVAGYIDLNPVRAGIVSDPKDYAFSGFGAAMSGDTAALEGLRGIYGDLARSPSQTLDAYRGLLYAKGVGEATTVSKSEEQNASKKPSLPLLLRTKIRAMTHGMAIGSKTFTADIYQQHRDLFSKKRRHPPKGIVLCPDWDGIQLCSVRQIRPPAASSPA